MSMQNKRPSVPFTADASVTSTGRIAATTTDRRVPPALRSVPLVLLIAIAVLFAGSPALQAQVESAVTLGTTENFSVLASSTITNTGVSTISGDVGLHPGTAVTGFAATGANSVVHTGTLHVTDGVALQAKNDLVTAYNDAAGFAETGSVPAQLGNQTFLPGVYTSDTGAFLLDGPLTLDAQGDENAVFIFKAGSTLTTGGASSVVLVGDASPCNIYWLVGSSATLGTNSTMRGIIMAVTSITLTTGATLEGKALAQGGAVTLDSNTIINPDCAVPGTADTTTTTMTTSTTVADAATTTTVAGTATTTPSGTTSDTLAPPVGGVDTGGGSTSQGAILAYAGFGLLVAAAGAFELRRRLESRQSA